MISPVVREDKCCTTPLLWGPRSHRHRKETVEAQRGRTVVESEGLMETVSVWEDEKVWRGWC